MGTHQHDHNPAPDRSRLSAHKWLKPRPLQSSPPQDQPASPQTETSNSGSQGFDLTKAESFASSDPPVSAMGQPLQAKLTLGEPNDQYEQEADRVAQDVVQRINTPQVDTPLGLPQNAPRDPLQRYPTETTAPLSPQLAPGAEPQVGRDITHEPLGIPAHVAQPLVLPQTPPSQIQADFESDLNAAKGGGSALETGLRAKVEGAMGADFSGVKVHTDAAAD